MEYSNFYANCAISAMQGIMESGVKFEEVASLILPEKLAKLSFDIADAMLDEYINRTTEHE